MGTEVRYSASVLHPRVKNRAARDMMGTKSMVGSKDDELSMKPATAIYPSRLSPIRPSLLKPFR